MDLSSPASDSEITKSYAVFVKGNDGNLWKRFQVKDVDEATRSFLDLLNLLFLYRFRLFSHEHTRDLD